MWPPPNNHDLIRRFADFIFMHLTQRQTPKETEREKTIWTTVALEFKKNIFNSQRAREREKKAKAVNIVTKKSNLHHHEQMPGVGLCIPKIIFIWYFKRIVNTFHFSNPNLLWASSFPPPLLLMWINGSISAKFDYPNLGCVMWNLLYQCLYLFIHLFILKAQSAALKTSRG